jgi:thioredoxin 1
MEVLNKDTFRAKIFDFETGGEWKFAGAKPAIVDFYADWCGPCRALAPILEKVEETYAGKVDIYKVDTEASPELMALFGIRGIPSILFVPMTGEPAMSSGLMGEEGFDHAIKDIFGIARG